MSALNRHDDASDPAVRGRRPGAAWATFVLQAAVVAAVTWALVAPNLLLEVWTDSAHIALIGKNLATGQGYTLDSVRDLSAPVVWPNPSRSYPPVMPVWAAFLHTLTGDALPWLGVSNVLFLGLAAAAAGVVAATVGVTPWAGPAGLLALLFTSGHFRRELFLGGTQPLVLMLWLLALAVLFTGGARAPGRWTKTQAFVVGMALAAVTLTRFDQLAPVGLLLVALSVLGVRNGVGRSVVASLWAGFAFAWLPWAVRNLLVFGTPLASDNGPSVLSFERTGAGYSFYADPTTVKTLKTAPGAWVTHRLGVLATYLRDLFSPALVVVPASVALIAVRWKTLAAGGRWAARGYVVLCAVLLGVTSLVPFHEPRYLSILAAFGWLWVSGIALRRFDSERASLVVGGLIVVVGVAVAARNVPRLPADGPSWLSPARPVNVYADALPMVLDLVPNTAIVGVQQPETFTYFTGLRSVVTPRNVIDAEAPVPDFAAWLRHWQIEWMVLDWEYQIDRFGVRPWVVAQAGKFVLVRVPPEARAAAASR